MSIKDIPPETNSKRPSDGSFISAKEARGIVENRSNKIRQEQMVEIEKGIKDAVSDNKYSVSFDGAIEYVNKFKLEQLGYKVTSGSQYNESYFSVSW